MGTVSVYFGEDLLERIDDRRGEQSRSGWVRSVLEDRLDEPTEDERLDDLENRLDALEQQLHEREDLVDERLDLVRRELWAERKLLGSSKDAPPWDRIERLEVD